MFHTEHSDHYENSKLLQMHIFHIKKSTSVNKKKCFLMIDMLNLFCFGSFGVFSRDKSVK